MLKLFHIIKKQVLLPCQKRSVVTALPGPGEL